MNSKAALALVYLRGNLGYQLVNMYLGNSLLHNVDLGLMPVCTWTWFSEHVGIGLQCSY